MRRARSERGTVLIVAIVFAVILALVAERLVRLAHARIRLYSETQKRQRSQLAYATALNELSNCVYGVSYGGLKNSSPQCPGWSAWKKCPSSCEASKTFEFGTSGSAVKFTVKATWNQDQMVIDVSPP